MKSYLLGLIIFFIGGISLCAQSKFGNATVEELEMTSYEKDTTASAVILNKDVLVRFKHERQGFVFELTQKVKIKILKTEGLTHADQEISYYALNRSKSEVIQDLSATTYNLENGKIVKTKMPKQNVFEEDTEEKWKKIKFAMPAAKVGSIIEYKYTLISPFVHELRDFVFQAPIPIEYVKYEAIIPEYFTYNLNSVGYVNVDSKREAVNEKFYFMLEGGAERSESGTIQCNAERYLFIAENVVAAKPETHLWSIYDYISKTSFELKSFYLPGGFAQTFTASWDKIDKDFMDSKNFGGNLKRASWFKDEVKVSESPTLDQAKSIRKIINNKVQWNETNSLFSSKLKDALDKGVGTSADMNFLLINALKAGGFDAFPVILSTRSNGNIPIAHPSANAFNYMITGLKIDTVYYFTDASDKFGDWNLLPQKVMVTQGRMLKDRDTRWVDLSTISQGTVFRKTNVKFTDNQVEISVDESRKGHDAYNARKKIDSYDNQEKFIQEMEEKNNTIIEDFVVTGNDDDNELFKNTYVEKKDMVLDGEHIYYTIPLAKLYTENPFKSETRIFPINFNYLQSYIQSVEVEVPDGYEIAELPKSERFVMPNNDITFTYNIQNQNNKIILNTRYQVRKLLFLPDEYPMLKEFFAKMILKDNEQIVLKKSSTKEELSDAI